MKLKILSLFLVLGLYLPLMAQHQQEFSINAGGGLSTLNYTPAYGKFTGGFGAETGLDYRFFFSPTWGLSTGVNLAFYNAEATMDNYSGRSAAKSPAGNDFDFAYAYTNYKEAVSSKMLTIPVMVQFQPGWKIGFYAAAGGKIGFPLTAQYTTTGNLSTTGYFPGTNVTYDDLSVKGFGDYTVNEKTDLDLNVSIMLSLEAGIKWRLIESMNLYTGVYFDYGLNNINKEKATDILTYNPTASSYPAGFNYGSVAGMSDKISPLALGIKLRLSFGYKAFQTQ